MKAFHECNSILKNLRKWPTRIELHNLKGGILLINLLSGTPGSGKSLDAAQRLYFWLGTGKPAVCNFEINLDLIPGKKEKKFYYKDNSELTPDFLIDFSKQYFSGKRPKEDSILLVIDEAQLIFNARSWDAKGRDKWLKFFTMHRHYGYLVLLLAQFDRMLDRQIRCLIEYEYIHRKVSNFGWKGKIISILALGNLFVSVKVWYPLNEKVGSEFFRAKRRYYRLYDTFDNLEEKANTATEQKKVAQQDAVTAEIQAAIAAANSGNVTQKSEVVNPDEADQ